ncbi:RNA polymerase I-specific transcription initiation factor RRN3-like isoform X1 [Olea europaea subsp. europaea]|uniref:RNA polymerase I-specific transcription initiation factor RRN3-like isoform X1 n=1 Tax=Olea europaea subsp. europaea TaxID=158383 RepID=A0A8S0TUC1_OLEEU|nr:RNA polymerase I-specific transcription initiation factor RRN3-like isoform X1 [Olea europaea subsp. europaea]
MWLCFRMKSMLSIPRLKSQLLLMRIEDILEHPLNPLQVCLPSIVEEFLRLAKANRVFAVPETFVDYGLLESERSSAFGGVERVDLFFPFDPCLLRKSDRFIRPNGKILCTGQW